MRSITSLLRNDHIIHNALYCRGALTGAGMPTREQLAEETGLTIDEVAVTLQRLRDQRLLSLLPDGKIGPPPKPLYLHYGSFRSFGQMLEYPDGVIAVDLLSAQAIEADSYHAEILRIPRAERMIRIRRLYSRDGVPFAHEEYNVLYSLLKNVTQAQFQKTSVFQIIRSNLPAGTDQKLVQSQYLSMLPSREIDRQYLRLTQKDHAVRVIGRIYHQQTPLCSFDIRIDPNQCYIKNLAMP